MVCYLPKDFNAFRHQSIIFSSLFTFKQIAVYLSCWVSMSADLAVEWIPFDDKELRFLSKLPFNKNADVDNQPRNNPRVTL